MKLFDPLNELGTALIAGTRQSGAGDRAVLPVAADIIGIAFKVVEGE